MNAHETLSLWESFYVIVGSSAGALTGLQFVVMAIVADTETETGQREVDAYGTPTIVHFCAVLVVAAIISAPWPGLMGPATTLFIGGLLGIAYTLIVMRRAKGTTAYKAVMEDWIFHAILPLIGYALLAISAAALPRYHLGALFGIATFSLLLLIIGIRNAWDTVTFVAVAMKGARKTDPTKS